MPRDGLHEDRQPIHADVPPGGGVVSPPLRISVRIGQRFGRLVVAGLDARTPVTPSRPRGTRAALCRCDCGDLATIDIRRLASGDTRSCGCLARENSSQLATANLTSWQRSPERIAHLIARNRSSEGRARSRTHGMGAHPLYQTWHAMIARCENPAASRYGNYGGRGIKVCARWHDIRVFIEDIESEIGPRPGGRTPGGRPLYTLDRADNDRDYEPGNVRWATYSQQNSNQHRRRVRRAAIEAVNRKLAVQP